ncbi:hypothetical protein PM082_020840 [Marasmius tenuissimus]|nr:hypothetical protein PM082_020840 [Marasmius tenuissimus]
MGQVVEVVMSRRCRVVGGKECSSAHRLPRGVSRQKLRVMAYPSVKFQGYGEPGDGCPCIRCAFTEPFAISERIIVDKNRGESNWHTHHPAKETPRSFYPRSVVSDIRGSNLRFRMVRFDELESQKSLGVTEDIEETMLGISMCGRRFSHLISWSNSRAAQQVAPLQLLSHRNRVSFSLGPSQDPNHHHERMESPEVNGQQNQAKEKELSRMRRLPGGKRNREEL